VSLVVITELDMNISINGTTLIVNANSVTLNVASYFDSNVGKVSIFRLNLFSAVIEKVAKVLINKMLGSGIDINWVINTLLGIHFIYFDEMNLTNYPQLLTIMATPVFNIT
jgi:hypothetical protein